MSEHQQRFQGLLRELFQFDSADLDFGIYRIMNHKRDVIERYIAEELPQIITDELSRGMLAEQAIIRKELAEAQEEISELLGPRAIHSDGNLQQAFHETPMGARYLNLQQRQAWHVARGADVEAFQTTVYNHLYTFFSRYYEDGDIISKRRYSRRERYAIPYNGEEVHLHWANKDQYYVKTGEHFRNYAFKAGGISARFVVVDANVEQGNVKGENRYFFPRLEKAQWREGERALDIPFEFRPATAADTAANGKNHLQEAIIEKAVADLPQSLDDAPVAALATERHRNGDKPVTTFEYHLRRYTRRNTTDFFIHKDLKSFLTREFDFYLKNEVLNIDGVETTDEITAEGWARGWFQTLRLMRTAAGQVIDFLDHAESFQKMIWEKRKFVTDVQYCVSLRVIDEGFYPEIAKCEAQWQEWQRLFAIDESESDLFNHASNAKSRQASRVAFLGSHPSLVLDTAHFHQDFVDRLIAGIADLENFTDGVLVNGENTQAVSLLLPTCAGRVACIHTDPPYNTQTSAFLYKNTYQHSSWMAMMDTQIALGQLLLGPNGAFQCHIDENEYERLRLIFGRYHMSNAGTVIWDKRNPMTGGSGIAIQHEYVIWYANGSRAFNLPSGNTQSILQRARELIAKHGTVVAASGEFADWVQRHDQLSGGEKAYRYLDESGRVYSSVSLRAPEPRSDPKFHEPLMHPVTGRPCPVPPNGFSRTPDTLAAMLANDEILFGADDTTQPRQKRMLQAGARRQFTSVYQSAKRGKTDLDNLGLGDFPYSHAVDFYMDLIGAAADERRAIVFDQFAGSGTTGHAVINLNREDGGERVFVLIELGRQFDDLMLPRVKKVMFSPDWKAGRPSPPSEEAIERSPRIVKYMRLESYEDALNNIEFDEAGVQRAMQLEDYVIKYMLKWETRDSATLLDIEQLARPFDYKLTTHANGNGGTERADVAETFNYLLGLRVRTRKVYYDGERKYLVYRGVAESRETVVVWRETAGWDPKDYRRDQQFLAARKITEDADVVYTNGVCFLAGAKALEPLFKERMFAPLP